VICSEGKGALKKKKKREREKKTILYFEDYTVYKQQ
jgi:hypothetical protein